jgi:hypothetical protein
MEKTCLKPPASYPVDKNGSCKRVWFNVIDFLLNMELHFWGVQTFVFKGISGIGFWMQVRRLMVAVNRN